MAQRTQDRRVLKTLDLLHQALMSLVLEKSYESISVQEILDRANVGRSTFYTHYRHKDELLLKAFDHLYSQLKEAQETAVAPPGKPYEKVIAFSEAMFAHADGYRKVWEALIRSQAGPIVRQRMQRLIEKLISDEFARKNPRRKKASDPLPHDLLVHFLASTLLALLTWWVDTRSNLSPESMNRMYRYLVLPELETAFT